MPLDIRIRFGRAIRRTREEQQINQEEAAERCGLHRTYYSGIERGIRNVSLVNIGSIARARRSATVTWVPLTHRRHRTQRICSEHDVVRA
jgi:transcriptional regulator with XRE-family HTH domain